MVMAMALSSITLVPTAHAQLRDITQIFPVPPGGAINKSFVQQIGPGRGDTSTVDSGRHRGGHGFEQGELRLRVAV
jgi:hypothetical protein